MFTTVPPNIFPDSGAKTSGKYALSENISLLQLKLSRGNETSFTDIFVARSEHDFLVQAEYMAAREIVRPAPPSQISQY